jgi:hypothetical protein
MGGEAAKPRFTGRAFHRVTFRSERQKWFFLGRKAAIAHLRKRKASITVEHAKLKQN